MAEDVLTDMPKHLVRPRPERPSKKETVIAGCCNEEVDPHEDGKHFRYGCPNTFFPCEKYTGS